MSIARADLLPEHPSTMTEPEHRRALAGSLWGPGTPKAHFYGHGRHMRAKPREKIAPGDMPAPQPPRTEIVTITRVVADRLHIHPELITSKNRSHVVRHARRAIAHVAYTVFAWHCADIAQYFNIDRSTAIRLRQRGASMYKTTPGFAQMCDEAAFVTDQAEIL